MVCFTAIKNKGILGEKYLHKFFNDLKIILKCESFNIKTVSSKKGQIEITLKNHVVYELVRVAVCNLNQFFCGFIILKRNLTNFSVIYMLIKYVSGGRTMEYILRDTDILDEDIGSLFSREIIANPDCFITGKSYRMIVSFHVNLLSDRRFEKFKVLLPSKNNTGKPTDIIYDVLGYQLHGLEQRLTDNGVEVNSATIQGEELEEERTVKIKMIEEDVVRSCSSQGKKEKLRKVFTIMPSKPYISDLATQMAGKELGEIYWNIMNIVKDKKLMSAVLEIEETENDKILIQAFLEQYRTLWPATGEKRNELVNQLNDKLLNIMVPK